MFRMIMVNDEHLTSKHSKVTVMQLQGKTHKKQPPKTAQIPSPSQKKNIHPTLLPTYNNEEIQKEIIGILGYPPN